MLLDPLKFNSFPIGPQVYPCLAWLFLGGGGIFVPLGYRACGEMAGDFFSLFSSTHRLRFPNSVTLPPNKCRPALPYLQPLLHLVALAIFFCGGACRGIGRPLAFWGKRLQIFFIFFFFSPCRLCAQNHGWPPPSPPCPPARLVTLLCLWTLSWRKLQPQVTRTSE